MSFNPPPPATIDCVGVDAPDSLHHVAIILDGNRRWAQEKGKSPLEGHRAGAKNLENIIAAANDLKIKYLSFFCFSSENWSRSQDEVSGLMFLLEHYLKKNVTDLLKNNIRLKIIGNKAQLSDKVIYLMAEAEQKTSQCTAMTVVMAVDYGGRWDITTAVKNIYDAIAAGTVDKDDLDEKMISAHLSTNFIGDPDLLIRTSGEQRLSNFFLWQCAYSEFVFSPQYWPDFSKESFAEAVDVFHSRRRRFGGT